ncbi:MAG: hypothetical protein RI897_174 [Verrucomicrobiota bacterium]
MSFRKKKAKQRQNPASRSLRGRERLEALGGGVVGFGGMVLEKGLSAMVGVAGGLNQRCRSSHLTVEMPAIVEQSVARKAVPMMAVGLVDPLTARMATAVMGRSWTELVLMARKVHMALVAVPGCGLSFSRSCMARSPRGVAALRRPSMLAAMFITMELMAGCPSGTSGKSRRRMGWRSLAMLWTRPAFSARRMRPSQNPMMPTRLMARVTAVSAPVTAPSTTPFMLPRKPPRSAAATMRVSQRALSMVGWV